MAAGPSVRRGVSLPQLSILDVAPIVLYSLGLAIPEDMEGRVPTGAFKPSWLQARPVRATAPAETSEIASPQAAVEIVYTEEEEKELAARLRALGYIE